MRCCLSATLAPDFSMLDSRVFLMGQLLAAGLWPLALSMPLGSENRAQGSELRAQDFG